MSLVWFATGGIAVIVAALVGYPLAVTYGPWWLAPLLAIPIGPATAALAVVARRCAADLRVTRTFYLDGLRTYWRPALGLSAIGMVVLALLCWAVSAFAALRLRRSGAAPIMPSSVKPSPIARLRWSKASGP